MKSGDLLPIGDLARRTGLSVSAIRFYETRGLVEAIRTRGGQRRFLRADLRRLSFIIAAQNLGYSLDAIAAVLADLPHNRTPSRADWERIAKGFRADIDARIAGLERLRNKLDACMGCGCLSLDKCLIYNRDDTARRHGQGPRYLLGNAPDVD